MISSLPFLGFPRYKKNYSNYNYDKPIANSSTYSSTYSPKKYQHNNFYNVTQNCSTSNSYSPINNNCNNSKTFSNCDNISSKKENIYSNSSKTTYNSSNVNSFNLENLSDEKNSQEYNQYINIGNFKLYFDDILILLILFFLYQEKINDYYLYLILILLLIN